MIKQRKSKNKILIGIVLLMGATTYAQSIAPQSVNSGGTTTSQSNGFLSFTVGELAVLSQTDNQENTLGSGFTAGASLTTLSLQETNAATNLSNNTSLSNEIETDRFKVENLTIEYLKDIQEFELPNGIDYEGNFIVGKRYKDQIGEYIALISQTGVYYTGEEGFRNAEIFAYNFSINNRKGVEKVWRVYDFNKDCPLDISVGFFDNNFQVTDLNHDGVAEIWLAYLVDCLGGVDPVKTKIIMYEGNQKYAMRGTVVFDGNQLRQEGGGYKFDEAFNKGPSEFRVFAKKMWSELGKM